MLLRCEKPDAASAAALACLRAEAPGAACTVNALDGGTLRYGARVQWLPGGQQCLEALLPALRGAARRIWLELTEAGNGVVWDTVLTALRQRAARGVDVRLILGPGCRLPGLRELRHMRIRWTRRALHVPGADCAVIDAGVCFAGAIILRDEWAGLRSSRRPWLAPCLRLEGGAAEAFALRFASRWQALTGQAPPELPPPADPGGYCYIRPLQAQALHAAVVRMIHRAEHSIWLLCPEPRLFPALRLAERAGVEVRVLGGAAPGLRTGVRTGRRIRAMACCTDGAAAVLGGRGGGLWLFGDGAAGLEQLLERGV